jgi:UrcA family protein
MFNRQALLSTLACAAFLAAANPVAAETRTVQVQSGDLNLTKDAGRTVLQQRIAHAIDAVCGPAHARTTADAQAYATCSKTAHAGALVQYDAMVAKAQADMKVAGNR